MCSLLHTAQIGNLTAKTAKGLGTLLEPHRKQVEGDGLRQKLISLYLTLGSPQPINTLILTDGIKLLSPHYRTPNQFITGHICSETV